MSGQSDGSKRRRVTRSGGGEQVDDGTSCCFCQHSIPYESECVQLQPCGCISCTKCLLDLHAKRGRSQPVCRCRQTIASHKFLSSERVPNVGVTHYKQEDEEEMKLKHPFEYVTKTMGDEFRSLNPGDEMLCLWGVRYTKTDKGQIRSNLLKVVTRRTSSPSSYSDESIDDLCKFFAWLSPSIVVPSVVKQNQVTTMSPRDFLEDAVANYTPLMAVLFGLATSNTQREKDKILTTSNHQDSQSRYLAIAMVVRQLYKNEVFTRLTSTGKPEAADQNMEKSVNHVRNILGKANRPGMEIKMEGACHKITEGVVGGQVKSDLRGQPQSTGGDGGNSRRRAKWLNAKSPILKAFDMIHNEMTLWDSKNGPTLSCDNGNRKYVKEGSIDIPMSKDGAKIVLRTNDCYRIGQARVKDYFHVYNVETPYRVDRSEKTSEGGVDLGRLLATTTDREDELHRLKTRGTSVDEDDVSDVFTVKELEAEIDKLVVLLNGDPYGMGVEKAPTKALKPQKVKKLVELRSIYFGQEADAKAEIEADVVAAFNAQYPEIDINEADGIDDIMDDPWWTLSKTILDSDRFSNNNK